ncbi:MAG: NAD(P)H-dependent glycerol-3-phosphate dehydrogenase [Firmicutes bacterium]|nr:NAD(P)H-dependent glycerol-3-phosphate dehydrogenase [Bacillota bacterium]
MKISVIGSGSFGTALAMLLTNKGHEVTIYGRNEVQMKMMASTGGNHKYLPGIILPKELKPTSDLNEALKDCELAVLAVPAQQLRSVISTMAGIRTDLMLVNVAKGIEIGTLRRMSEIMREYYPDAKIGCLSGPSHAEEVARYLPTTVCAASDDPDFARLLQQVFMDDNFRVYTNNDLIGVELGGAVKNIIALCCGISDGLGLGDNAKAALITRGIAEMTRLGVAMGGRPETFAGLSGIGDLVVTCTSMHSRNRRFGILLGQGMDIDSALEKIGMVVEGYTTQVAATELADKYNVEMPITNTLHKLLLGEIDADECIGLLMGRKEKHE